MYNDFFFLCGRQLAYLVMGSELYFHGITLGRKKQQTLCKFQVQVCSTCVDLIPHLVAKGMLQLLLEDKSKVGAAMLVRPKVRISYFTFVGEHRKAKL